MKKTVVNKIWIDENGIKHGFFEEKHVDDSGNVLFLDSSEFEEPVEGVQITEEVYEEECDEQPGFLMRMFESLFGLLVDDAPESLKKRK